MPDQARNLVKQTISNTPGTSGALTLSAASTGYLALGAGDDGQSFSVTILASDSETADKEVRTGCVYTHSTTSLSRGTLESGTAINLTSTAVAAVTASAAAWRQWNAAALSHVAGTDADTTMECNTLYVVDMSAWATADRTYTLPATAAVGDRVGIAIKAGDASHELPITAASGDTLNAVAGGTEWSRLFITGEVVIMRCVAANATWVVEYDGRIPCAATWQATGSGSTTQSISASTWTKVLDDTFNTELFDVGSVMGSDGTNIAATIRRAGNYELLAGIAVNSVADQKEAILGMFLNAEGTPSYRLARLPTSGTNNSYPKGSITVSAAAGDAYTIAVYQTDTVSRLINDSVGYNVFSLKEML